MDFSLKQTTTKIIQTRREQPWVLMDLVVAIATATPDEELRGAYVEALTEYARVALGRALADDDDDDDDDDPMENAPSGRHEKADKHNHAGSRVTIGRQQRLLRRAGFRHRVWISAGTWKPIQFCTVEELRIVRDESERNEIANREAKDRVDRLILLIEECGVTCAQELDPEVLIREFLHQED